VAGLGTDLLKLVTQVEGVVGGDGLYCNIRCIANVLRNQLLFDVAYLAMIKSSCGDLCCRAWMAGRQPTGPKWQESHFAQPKVARRAKCMDALNDLTCGDQENESP